MEKSDLKDLLEQNGYEAFLDETQVVTVSIDPAGESASRAAELIRGAGWNGSYGFRYSRRPEEWAAGGTASCSGSGKAEDKGRKGKRKAGRPKKEAHAAEAGSGTQMSIFDFMGGYACS